MTLTHGANFPTPPPARRGPSLPRHKFTAADRDKTRWKSTTENYYGTPPRHTYAGIAKSLGLSRREILLHILTEFGPLTPRELGRLMNQFDWNIRRMLEREQALGSVVKLDGWPTRQAWDIRRSGDTT